VVEHTPKGHTWRAGEIVILYPTVALDTRPVVTGATVMLAE
jgi:hypothetical protein